MGSSFDYLLAALISTVALETFCKNIYGHDVPTFSKLPSDKPSYPLSHSLWMSQHFQHFLLKAIPLCYRNHRTAEVGRYLWRLPSSPPSSEQGQLEQGAQGSAQSGFEYLQGWRLCSLSGQHLPVFNHPSDNGNTKLCCSIQRANFVVRRNSTH